MFFFKMFFVIFSEGWSRNIWAASFFISSFLFYLFFILSFFFIIVSEGWSNTPTTWKPWLKREPTATWKRKRSNCPISFLIIFTMIWLYDDNYSLSRCEDLLHELLPSSVARFNVILFSNLSDRFQKGLSFFNFFQVGNYSFLQCFVFYKKKSDLYFKYYIHCPLFPLSKGLPLHFKFSLFPIFITCFKKFAHQIWFYLANFSH